MTKTKAPHPDDLAQAAEIAKATEFVAFYRNGPHEKVREPGFPSYEAAKARVAEIVAERSRHGRGGLVYAVNALGSFPCDDRMIALARSLMPAPAPGGDWRADQERLVSEMAAIADLADIHEGNEP